MLARAAHRHHAWIVDQPITVGLIYRTKTGAQAYKVVRILHGDSRYAVCVVERQNGVYQGNHDTHTLRHEGA